MDSCKLGRFHIVAFENRLGTLREIPISLLWTAGTMGLFETHYTGMINIEENCTVPKCSNVLSHENLNEKQPLTQLTIPSKNGTCLVFQ